MENRYFEYRQYKNGLLSEEEWQARLFIALENHGIRRGQQWWSKVGRKLYPPDFVDLIDNLLRNETHIDIYKLFATWDGEE